MKTLLFGLFTLVLTSCATNPGVALKYTELDESSNLHSISIPSDTLKFGLQDSLLTLAPYSFNSSPTSQKLNCPEGINHENWWECFSNETQLISSVAPADLKKKNSVYLVSPDDSSNYNISKTSIQAVTVNWQNQLQGQPPLYSSIAIKYSNNTNKIISNASSAAISGFELAGPGGAVIGLLLGALDTTFLTPKSVLLGYTPPLGSYLSGFICKGEDITFSSATESNLMPMISFPITVRASDAMPISTKDEVNSDPSNCWHTLPNNVSRNTMLKPNQIGIANSEKKVRNPVNGDGWLYRLVATDDPSKPPQGAIKREDFFNPNKFDNRQKFPYSSCRNVKMEITWWKDLAQSIKDTKAGEKPHPSAIRFDAVINDSNFVSVANVEKGGIINFNSDCGANVTSIGDQSNASTFSVIVVNSLNLYEAQKAWENEKR
jgi:hypothetical protein